MLLDLTNAIKIYLILICLLPMALAGVYLVSWYFMNK